MSCLHSRFAIPFVCLLLLPALRAQRNKRSVRSLLGETMSTFARLRILPARLLDELHFRLCIRSFAILMIPLLLSQVVDAQSAPATDSAIGLPVGSHFDGDSIASVQIENGNLHIELPIVKEVGRGPAIEYKFVYDSLGFQVRPGNPPSIAKERNTSFTLIGPGRQTFAILATSKKLSCGANGTVEEFSNLVIQ